MISTTVEERLLLEKKNHLYVVAKLITTQRRVKPFVNLGEFSPTGSIEKISPGFAVRELRSDLQIYYDALTKYISHTSIFAIIVEHREQ